MCVYHESLKELIRSTSGKFETHKNNLLSKTLYIEKKENAARDCSEKVTKETEASAARARISAQDTTPGHEVSRVLLMLSTTSNPRTELALGSAVFSLCVMLPLTSSKMDPSQP